MVATKADYMRNTKADIKSLLPFFICLPFFLISIISCNNVSKHYPQKSIVWEAGENNVDGYRIPGIVVTTKGTVLAFAEERQLYGDADIKSIVLKRSEDQGKTWSQNIYIEKCDCSYWHEHANEIDPRDAKNKKEVWTNPASLVDKQTGRIIIFYALSEGKLSGQNLQRYTKVFYKYSDDDGLSWSDRKEVTDILNAKEDGSPNVDKNGEWITDVNGFPCDYLGRAFHMPGPGHGIQLTNGRLLLSVWNRTALGVFDKGSIPSKERNYGICTIYSDDHGKTWKYGSSFCHGQPGGGEARMVQLKNGDIYLNTRYGSIVPGKSNTHRMTAISHDNGINWTDIKIDKNFPLSNPCDAGLIALNNQRKHIILYSKNESLEGRKNLVVRQSYDEGKSWPVARVMDEGPAWYSDMTLLPDNTILLIYETGKNSPVYCISFNLKWITNNE